MRVFVINPFFDEKGLHKKGETCEVTRFNPKYMTLLEEDKQEVVDTQDVVPPVKKTTRKTTRKKKG
jgi:hypothetical protein